MGLITVNVLACADSVLVPIQCEYYALEGLSQLIGTVRKIKKSYNKNIEIEGMEEVPQSYVYGDFDLLYQTIYNLFDNAIKFTPENGIISVDIDETNNYIKIKITNSGEGISEEDLTHIFERFYKSDKSRSMDKTGFGLGLHIVKSIVDIHNGKVSVESEYGKSTTFSITLPNNNGMK